MGIRGENRSSVSHACRKRRLNGVAPFFLSGRVLYRCESAWTVSVSLSCVFVCVFRIGVDLICLYFCLLSRCFLRTGKILDWRRFFLRWTVMRGLCRQVVD